MKKVVITCGYFNPVHRGHIDLLKEARALGDFLLVIINNDNQVRLKGSAPFMKEDERMLIINSLKYVDEVMLSVDETKSIAESLKKAALKFKDYDLYFAKGGDRNIGNLPEEEILICNEFNIKIINGVGGEKAQSSSWLIENVVNKFFNLKIMKSKFENIKSIEVLGNRIDMVQEKDVIEMMDYWIQNDPEKARWIVVTGMHGVMESQKNKEFKDMLNSSDLWVADGISIVWLARMNGFKLKKRVAGPDLFREFLKFSNEKGYKHYFYGDTDQTLAKLKEKLSKKLPNIKMEAFSPPFRDLTDKEQKDIIDNINKFQPDVLWVGLGLPKQEKWIFNNRKKINASVVVGVGAAFKFEAGTVKRAPAWMGNIGLEWLWRLFQEPKRIWRRVFVDGPQFMWLTGSRLFRAKTITKDSNGVK